MMSPTSGKKDTCCHVVLICTFCTLLCCAPLFFQYELVVKYCGTHCFLHKHSSFVRRLSRCDVGAISWRSGRCRYRGLGQVRQLWPRPRLAKRQRGTPLRPEQIRRRLVRGGGERQRLDLR